MVSKSKLKKYDELSEKLGTKVGKKEVHKWAEIAVNGLSIFKMYIVYKVKIKRY